MQDKKICIRTDGDASTARKNAIQDAIRPLLIPDLISIVMGYALMDRIRGMVDQESEFYLATKYDVASSRCGLLIATPHNLRLSIHSALLDIINLRRVSFQPRSLCVFDGEAFCATSHPNSEIFVFDLYTCNHSRTIQIELDPADKSHLRSQIYSMVVTEESLFSDGWSRLDKILVSDKATGRFQRWIHLKHKRRTSSKLNSYDGSLYVLRGPTGCVIDQYDMATGSFMHEWKMPFEVTKFAVLNTIQVVVETCDTRVLLVDIENGTYLHLFDSVDSLQFTRHVNGKCFVVLHNNKIVVFS